MDKELLLASQSPRRRELVGLLGFPFSSIAADVDERILANETPADYVLRLAEAKARACAKHENGTCSGQIVIGSDTAVVDAGAILGKPKDEREAEVMLRQLRGRTHQVYTAIALFDSASDQVITELSISDVPMRAYSDAELEAYVASGDPLDKAGAYAIQNADFHPVERFAGCYASVMGLPLCHLARSLRTMGAAPKTHVPAQCQAALAYDCPVYQTILCDENQSDL